MGRITGLKGMRHVALKVKNVAQSKMFYQEILGMDVVWEPDAENVYLSSGCDNIAIHGVSANFAASTERVKELEQEFIAKGVRIVYPFKAHRDGSASFYCADPDGIVIQMLYEPHLSMQRIE